MIKKYCIYIIILAASIMNSCSTKFYSVNRQSLPTPLNTQNNLQSAPYIKLHMLNGMVYILSDWQIAQNEEFVSGNGDLYGINRNKISSGDFSVPVDQIAIAETNILEGITNSLSAISIISAGLSGFCIVNPKACFGSCPTFYISDGDSMALMAEGFSSSTTPAWEATDVDALFLADPKGKEIRLKVTNEAHETHAIRSIKLLAFPKLKGKRVIRTTDEKYFQSNLIYPSVCNAAEGDILPEVLFFDKEERFSAADDNYLAEKEYIEVSFDNITATKAALVLGKRQTLLSTFIYYESLDYMGAYRGDNMARIVRGDKMVSKGRKKLLETLGGIDVQVLSKSGQWTTIGTDMEAGPIARDVVGIPLPTMTDNSIKIRLRLTKGLWRIDYIALAELEKELNPMVLNPLRVENSNKIDPKSLKALLDPDQYFTTIRGDVYNLFFTMPDSESAYEWFLESRGYYLEWHRDEWLKNNNELALAELLVFPRRALKRLAPQFKKIEHELEETFWNSRYEIHNNH